MKRVGVFVLGALLVLSVTSASAAGFDEFGYNKTARVFVGTYLQWCMGKFGYTEAQCTAWLGTTWLNDQIVMKWNKEWDRGNAEGWQNPPYNAWEDNEWNGSYPDGSGEVWHYKIVWVGSCGSDGAPLPDGGYCLWGQFEVIMDQGTSADHEHFFLTRATPAGYGAYYSIPSP